MSILLVLRWFTSRLVLGCSPVFGSKLFTDCSLRAQNRGRARAIIFKLWRLANASNCSSIKSHTCGTAFAASICRAIVGTQRPHHAPVSNRLDGRQTSSARRRRCHTSGAVQAQNKSLDDVLCTRDAAQLPIGDQRLSGRLRLRDLRYYFGGAMWTPCHRSHVPELLLIKSASVSLGAHSP